ncbi:metal ABC transporter ATP-binding protein [Sulfurospirillum sp. 1612]|uniref:metal ABC transporter ATP-binding protein n=1 Tax=Sulfurospirillum sp. 1612 TaxID=3094835 RepID=UPI002F953F74
MPILEVEDVSFSYEKQKILEHIKLSVEEKDYLAIIGPNGGGKTTFLKLILGINKMQEGSIKIAGKEAAKQLSMIGYVPQNTNINVDFPIKVIEVVLMGYTGEKTPFFGYSKEEIAQAKNALKQVGMQDFINTKIGALSGGQRQRVLIARALCANPKILLLDEPTSSIDAQGQEDIYKLLQALNKEITIVVVSHDISVIIGYAKKVAYINKTLVMHDISIDKERFQKHGEHFCEVELLNLLKERV